MKRRILSERNLVVILFVMVFVIFSLAQEDTRKIEKMYQEFSSSTTSSLNEVQKPEIKTKTSKNKDIAPPAQLR